MATVIRANKNFTKISNKAIEDMRLTPPAFWLLSYCMHLKVDADFMISVKRIAYLTRRNENTLNKAMNLLRTLEYVKRVPIYENGRRKGYNYTINDNHEQDDVR
jgi:predicted transcriptional regulator